MRKKIAIIDLNHIIYAWGSFGIENSFTLAEDKESVIINDVKPVSKIFYFLNSIKKQFDGMIVVGDTKLTSRPLFISDCCSTIDVEYKENRKEKPLHWKMFRGVVESILKENNSKIPFIKQEDYEADDLIFATIRTLREKTKDIDICIFTNDMDLVPLMCIPNVYIFRKDNKNLHETYSSLLDVGVKKYTPIVDIDDSKNELSKVKYYAQVKDVINYKNLLLMKMIAGDVSDNIPRIKGYTPGKCAKLFRELEAHREKTQIVFKYTDNLVDVLTYNNFLNKHIKDKTVVNAMMERFFVMNLNQKYVNKNQETIRESFSIPFEDISYAVNEDKYVNTHKVGDIISISKRIE